MAGTSYVSMAPVEIEEFLLGLSRQLASALHTPSFSAALGRDIGYKIGTALVAADFDSPEGLGRTVRVIHDRLLSDLGLSGDAPRGRLSSLLEALVAGHVRARHDRTLDEQEEIRRAALLAREEAQQALRASEARYRHQALHDPLTGLPNRAMLADRLAHIFASDSAPVARLAVCLLDLDGFKAINDGFGHDLGDQLLIAVASRLGSVAASAGHLVTRLGGDEFAILVENTSCADNAIEVADRALAALREPIYLGGQQLSVSASMGIAERPVAETDPADAMRAADIALYWAKANGKGQWALFDPQRNAQEVARHRLSAAIPAALERNEFTLHYQPLVDLSDGSIRGAEALPRWHHPELGVLAPHRFIDLAENTGMIVPLGARLLELACGQAVRWQQQLAPTAPFVSVNLSVRQLRHTALVADVATILDHSGLPPHRLQLEITESAVMGTGDETLRTMHALADIGIRLAIDDFGTGYSNLAYLRALPVHGLKLADVFVRGLRTPNAADPTDVAILATLVSLGHTLGLTITAEGVETAVQAHRLRAIKCDLGQGCYLGGPQHLS
jgi:diguanylate cyclase (GGDEF)-like protein